MKCPNCGASNPPLASRCDCGHALENAPAPSNAGSAGGLEGTPALEEAEALLAELGHRFEAFSSQLAKLQDDVNRLKAAHQAGEPASSMEPVHRSRPSQPVESTAPSRPSQAGPESSMGVATGTETQAALPAKPPPPKRRRTSPELEALIAGNWLLKIGVLSIFLGALYFLKFAFDNRWIGDTGRVLIGVVSGLALLYGGLRFHKQDYRLYGQTLAGGGVSVLYLSIYAAFNFYTLVPQIASLLLMVLVTGICSLLSARLPSGP